jgi:hypothetical protein
MNQKTIIEINGVKMEVDLRQARRLDTIQVGTRVKVLTKEYSSWKVNHGVVIGFEPFKTLPTIIIAFADVTYNSAKIGFLYYNAESKDVEVVVASDDDIAALDQNDFIKQVDREIAKAEAQIKELEDRKRYFLDKFKCYWTEAEKATADAIEGVDELDFQ